MKEEFCIDNKRNELVRKVILARKRKPISLSVEEMRHILFHEEVTIFISEQQTETRTELQLISQEEMQQEWETRYKDNICVEEDIYIEDYPNGYYFCPDFMEQVAKELRIGRDKG
ncbi:hypothetical protein [Priestia taiwanensis]|uniref:Uncharacterized protein n=1 Tax=Priestia taiwanensis TaxID=1347902 RepID=A0A917ALC9_9BACI|nr:hypothetical protein [Priestia taiwanensis]MBM7362023.1 hypothetical protein [Priestia taiwanensis]GGE58840.1 hypothetical protein GCM10007140_06480 [Priestia taiwanensis]